MSSSSEHFSFAGGVTLKNRLLLAPMTTDSGTVEGGLSKEDCEFLLRRSAGFGAVIVGSHSVSPLGSAFQRGWNLYHPANHAALKSLVNQVHAQDTKIILQIYHAGRMAQPAFIGGEQPLAPSRVPALRPFASFPREMTVEEIEEVIQDFEEATATAISLGFDGIELHGANTYLLQQFFSPHSNRREDEWGGSLEKRLRFPLEIVRACHAVMEERAGRPFLLGYRFSPEEIETPGIRLEDTCRLLAALSHLPLDYFHVSLSDFRKLSKNGERIIDVLLQAIPAQVPLIACGNIRTRRDAEAALEKTPLLSVGNASVIDPDWPEKVLRKSEDIKRVLRANEREALAIPRRLWEAISGSPDYFLDAEMRG